MEINQMEMRVFRHATCILNNKILLDLTQYHKIYPYPEKLAYKHLVKKYYQMQTIPRYIFLHIVVF